MHSPCGQELDAPVSDHDARFRSAAIKVMTQVARGTGRLPPALWMSNIVHGEHATTGGGFGDVYLGSWGDKEVALKFLRHFTRQSNAEMEKVSMYLDTIRPSTHHSDFCTAILSRSVIVASALARTHSSLSRRISRRA
jgi:hypothetical protein